MSLHICLICDKCEAQSLPYYGTATDARSANFPSGWVTDLAALDLCPVCSGEDLNYWTTEPF
jgi:hypothetical protein